MENFDQPVPPFLAAPPPGATADIRAVAERAGVSISTVSRYLNGKKRVRAETEKRIRSAVAAFGYAPNRVARSLRLNRTMTLGLLIPDNSNPYFSGLVKGADDAAREAGYALVLFNSNEERERERGHLQTLQALHCDGALLIAAPEGPDEEERWGWLRHFPLPIVCLDRAAPLPVDTVEADNEAGGYEATRFLLGLGHRRIGLVTVAYEASSQRGRTAGYARALAEAGVPRRPDYEARVPLTVEGGLAGSRQLLSLTDRPSALFATSNFLAIGAVAAVQARGLRCPDDVSIVGYDSYPWQDVFSPRLTTVKQPSYEIGRRATELLLRRINNGNTEPPQRVVFRPALVVRASCAPYRD